MFKIFYIFNYYIIDITNLIKIVQLYYKPGQPSKRYLFPVARNVPIGRT